MAVTKKAAKTAKIAKVAKVAKVAKAVEIAGRGSQAAAAAVTAKTDFTEAARCIQLASSRIECADKKISTFSLPSAHQDLQRAVECLRDVCNAEPEPESEAEAERSLGDASERELGLLLLLQVSGLRKTAMRVLLGKLAHIGPAEGGGAKEFVELCKVAVVGCVSFLAWYLGRAAGPDDVLKDVEFKEKERRGTVSDGLVPAFVESALYCVKGWIAEGKGTGEREGEIRGVGWQGWESALDEIRLFVSRLRDGCLRGTEGREGDEPCQRLKELDMLLLKVSHLYTAAFLKKKAADDRLDERTISFLARSVTAIQFAPREVKDQASYATKLEKLGALYERSGRLAEASAMYNDAIRYQLELEASSLAMEGSSGIYPNQILGPGGKAGTLGRALLGFVRVSTKIPHSKSHDMRWWDDENISEEKRCMMLEWQLEYVCSQLGTDRDQSQTTVKRIIKLLSNIYKPGRFSLMRKRLMITILQIKDVGSGAYDTELDELRASSKTFDKAQTRDPVLAALDEHCTATLLAFQAFKDSPDDNLLEQALQKWENIVQTAENDNDIRERIDTRSLWITQMKAMSDFYDMKGIDDLRTRSLETLARGLQLFRPVDEDLLLSTQCKLGRQYLKTESSGKAGMVLAKAQKLLSSAAVQTATRLEWHLAYAEYLMLIGNQEKCGESLLKVSEIAEADEFLSSASQHTQTMSERIQTNSLLSEASYLASVHQFQRGYLQNALRHAKGCVSLNQRNWINLESKWRSKTQLTPNRHSEINLSRPTTTKETEIAQAPPMAPESLHGAAFWTLVPSLVKCFSHLADILVHQGLFQESVHYLERAEKIACSVNADPHTLPIINALTLLYARSNRLDKAKLCNEKATAISAKAQPSAALVNHYLSVAQLYHSERNFIDEMNTLELAIETFDTLSATSAAKLTEETTAEVESVTELLSDMVLGAKTNTKQNTTITRKGTRIKKEGTTSVVQKSDKQRREVTAKQQDLVGSTLDIEQSRLDKLQGKIQRRKALCLLRQGRQDEASICLSRANATQSDFEANIEQRFSWFRKLLAQGMEELASDFTFNCLPESTISFPAAMLSTQPLVPLRQGRTVATSPRKAKVVKKSSSAREKNPVPVTKRNFADTLFQARECLGEVYATALCRCSTWLIHQIYKSMCQITILLSAASSGTLKAVFQPCSVAFSLEAARNCAVQREHDIYRGDIVNKKLGDKLPWPKIGEDCAERLPPNLSRFQAEFIDIIPSTWCAISISLNEARDELYMARYDANQSPFILRLPLSRHISRDLGDEESFGFEEAKTELLEIIQLSTFSTQNAREISGKAEKKAWWSEREALDRRLHSLLQNIQNIWMGGFRGIFSQHPRRCDLLARFQKSLDAILERYLPSRQRAKKRPSLEKTVLLDPRILELFVGLGDPNSEELDLDEPLTDLLYYIVDILQYNGERNAIDEIDFDSMVIETTDALKYYHSCASSAPTPNRHIILILDKHLHSFPWESLSCLEGLSISRLPSLLNLQQRIKDYKCTPQRCNHESLRNTKEGHLVNVKKGASILNPSGDLSQTQKFIQPVLQNLPSEWKHIAARFPIQDEFSDALTSSDLLLYFGHGSGAQYLPNSVLRKSDVRAVTWLMGCSSGAITENGEFEPHGTVLSYLMAGAPAVLATLWDVTDKDCDRFSLKCGEMWGLWAEDVSQKIELPRRPAGKKADGCGGRKNKGQRSLDVGERERERMSLDEAVMRSRDACYLRYLNGAAPVVYGIPAYLN